LRSVKRSAGRSALLVVTLVVAVIVLSRMPSSGSGADAALPDAPGASAAPRDPTSTPSTASTPRRGASTARSATTEVSGKARIRLRFAGDINFTGPLSAALASDPATALAAISPALHDADLSVANLETAVTSRGTAAAKQYAFRAPASSFTALEAAGLDVVTMANNHGLDFGLDGVDDALAASKSSGLPVIGIGRDEDQAYRPFETTIRGHRVAVIGATQVIDDNLIESWTATATHPGLASAKRVDRLLAEVRATRARTDTLVVFLHWGIETHTCPSETQETLARQLVDAGADIVVGSHAHRVEGGGRLGQAIVDYGLGNFAFDAPSAASSNSGIFQVAIGGGKPTSYEWLPAHIGGDNVPRLLTGAAKADADRTWDSQRACTGLDK
jgi:poly-gamma-glutamate synthesis protein (capsule biosynthesis protein)